MPQIKDLPSIVGRKIKIMKIIFAKFATFRVNYILPLLVPYTSNHLYVPKIFSYHISSLKYNQCLTFYYYSNQYLLTLITNCYLYYFSIIFQLFFSVLFCILFSGKEVLSLLLFCFQEILCSLFTKIYFVNKVVENFSLYIVFCKSNKYLSFFYS